MNWASNQGCIEFVNPSLANCTMATHDSCTDADGPDAAFSISPRIVGFMWVGAK